MEDTATIITGANRGIGYEITKALAVRGERLIMACRDPLRGEEAAGRLRAESDNPDIEVLTLDLSSLDSIRSFADGLRSRDTRVRVLVNNAGVLSRTFRTTADGFELTMATNYIGPFLLTRLLLPLMRRGVGKIVNTSSLMYRYGRADERLFDAGPDTWNGFRAYADSKLALLLFSLDLARRLEPDGISVDSVDPGIVNTGMLKLNAWFDPITDFLYRPLVRTAETAAKTAVRIALSGTEDRGTGRYFVHGRERRLPGWVRNHPHAAALREATERVTGIRVPEY